MLFSKEYFDSLECCLQAIPQAQTVRFVVSSTSRQIKHVKHYPPIDDTNCNVCIIDVSTTPNVSHRHGNVLTYSLAQQITETLYNRLKDDLTVH
jgi:hypothetical protein